MTSNSELVLSCVSDLELCEALSRRLTLFLVVMA